MRGQKELIHKTNHSLQNINIMFLTDILFLSAPRGFVSWSYWRFRLNVEYIHSLGLTLKALN